tara:strand:+ start:672 stop:1034 length:363 start_codon:yes stop_codon:yes gene_type:complete
MKPPVKIIMAAGKIPNGSTVTKLRGTKEYLLKGEIRVFPVSVSSKERRARKEAGEELPKAQIIKALGGTCFLVCDGDANAIPSTLELIWLARPDAAIAVLKQTPYDDSEICILCGHYEED